VELLAWSEEDGTGAVTINGTAYHLERLTDRQGRTIGCRLSRPSEDAARVLGCPVKIIDVDFTVSPWACDCEQATYNPERGPCKHCQALKSVGQLIRERAEAEYLALWEVSERRR
jgi:hypothetical protein